MGGGVGPQALEADTEEVAAAGTSPPVFWFAIYAMTAGKMISGGHLSSSALSRTFTCQGTITLGEHTSPLFTLSTPDLVLIR